MKYLSKLAGIGMLTASLYGCGGNGGTSVNPVININGYSKLNKTCTGIVNVSVDAENGKN